MTLYRHMFGRLVYTIGVNEAARENGAYWLIDLIASHQTPQVAAERFQVWTLSVNLAARTAEAVCTDGGKDGNPEVVVARQRIEYTDYPSAKAVWWAVYDESLAKPVLMLPSEY